MTNPRMTERNRLWKRRVSAFGLALFIALSALIGKQAEQSPVAAAPADTTGGLTLPATTTTIAPTATTAVTSTTNTSSTSSSSSTSAIHTRTTSSR